MGVFDFLNVKNDDAPRVDEHAKNLGADSSPAVPNVGGVAAHEVVSARDAALRLSSESTKRRGRPRKDQTNSGTNNDAVQTKVNAEILAALDQVHDPKAWGALLSAPADVALTLTGREYWNVKDRERDTLGACGSACARTMMITNPKALAFLMLAAGVFSVYMPRLTLELKHQREEAAKAKERQRQGIKPDEQK